MYREINCEFLCGKNRNIGNDWYCKWNVYDVIIWRDLINNYCRNYWIIR